MAIKIYEPTIGKANWKIKEMNKDERHKILERLKVSITHNEEDYQAVIGYLHEKYPDLMDANPSGMNLQWKYAPHKNKTESLFNNKDEKIDMYAFCWYDPLRDNEIVSWGGSYFKDHKPTNDDDMVTEEGYTIWGHGYVLFVDPDYRRMGIADIQWTSEAKFYNDCYFWGIPKKEWDEWNKNTKHLPKSVKHSSFMDIAKKCPVRYQYDIQNEDSLAVTQSMFSSPDKCKIVAEGRIKNDGTRAGIRILMDYSDKELLDKFENYPENVKNFYNDYDWSFLNRESFTKEELIKPWNK